jgi:hypothetical protein
MPLQTFRVAKIFKNGQYQILAKMQRNKNAHSLFMVMQNGMTTLEDILKASYKI